MNLPSRFSSVFVLFFLLSGSVWAGTYQYSIDLRKVSDDKISVELLPPALREDSLLFQFPVIVPGTYSVYNFGRFVSNLKAVDILDQELPVQRINDNAWLILDGKRLQKISYTVDDTWDAFDKDNFVFEPGGTNIEADKNFVLNGHGFFGYFEGYKDLPFELKVQKPAGFFGATALENSSEEPGSDRFKADDYFELVDSPIMYCMPDTSVIEVGGAEILFSVYSPGKEVESEFIAKEVKDILQAQKAYLGGTLPIKRYAFIIYLFDSFGGSGAYGALEHNTSSLYFLPEFSGEYLGQTIRDFAAHEFFHIVTPLNIHSEHIHDFNFMKPRMSRHLWMYEGVTEYSAGHVQVKHGLIDMETYLDKIKEQIISSRDYDDDLPFTKMSEGCLDKYEAQYGNVYQKGALIGLCLDILLLKESEGDYDLQQLMADLAKEYGPERPFYDSLLFSKIEEMTYPAVGDFLNKHVAGKKALPLKEMLAEVGVYYAEELEVPALSFGNPGLGINSDGKVEIESLEEVDAFGKRMGYKEGDVLLQMNGKDLSPENIVDMLTAYFDSAKEGDPLEFLVLRAKKAGKKKKKKVKLAAKLSPVMKTAEDVIFPMEEPTPQQAQLRKSWIGQ